MDDRVSLPYQKLSGSHVSSGEIIELSHQAKRAGNDMKYIWSQWYYFLRCPLKTCVVFFDVSVVNEEVTEATSLFALDCKSGLTRACWYCQWKESVCKEKPKEKRTVDFFYFIILLSINSRFIRLFLLEMEIICSAPHSSTQLNQNLGKSFICAIQHLKFVNILWNYCSIYLGNCVTKFKAEEALTEETMMDNVCEQFLSILLHFPSIQTLTKCRHETGDKMRNISVQIDFTKI